MSQNFPRHELFLFRFFPQPFKNLKTILSWQEKQAVAGLGSLGVACTLPGSQGTPQCPVPRVTVCFQVFASKTGHLETRGSCFLSHLLNVQHSLRS